MLSLLNWGSVSLRDLDGPRWTCTLIDFLRQSGMGRFLTWRAVGLTLCCMKYKGHFLLSVHQQTSTYSDNIGKHMTPKWGFHYRTKWEYSLSVLRVFLKYQPTCSSSWLQTAVWYSCMCKMCHQLCFLFKVMSHNLWVFSQFARSKFSIITHLSLMYGLSKVFLYTKTEIVNNKMIC